MNDFKQLKTQKVQIGFITIFSVYSLFSPKVENTMAEHNIRKSTSNSNKKKPKQSLFFIKIFGKTFAVSKKSNIFAPRLRDNAIRWM